MEDKKILISCGPIPAKLDSVKYITNRFKGGLAFKTASTLYNKGYDVTVVKWKHTPIPTGFRASNIIDVDDVVEYYNGIKQNAKSYDVFIMAAAVANLMPSNPYEGKFPSHNYSVGEQFDIKFEIAPRAIDIVKKINPRATLIGYKLFDANTDEELIEIGRHTLHDSKANVIFANTPMKAKTEKIALMQDNSVIKMNFDEHINFIIKLINSTYFKTTLDYTGFENFNTIDITNTDIAEANEAKGIVEAFDLQFRNGPKFGTVAVKTKEGMITTARGHNDKVVLVKNVDFTSKLITATGKATLNAPLLWKMLENEPIGSYVIHRHTDDPNLNPEYTNWTKIGYEFPGTLEEVQAVGELKRVYIEHHGYLDVKHPSPVEWGKYYEQFPSKYFGEMHDIMSELVGKYKDSKYETLEIGGNTHCICKYNLDANMPKEGNNITYSDLSKMQDKFDFILLRNCINYLSPDELQLAIDALKPGGIICANSFKCAPYIKVTSREVSVQYNNKINHTLIVGDQLYKHSFYSRSAEEYCNIGFKVDSVGVSSVILTYEKKK